MSGIRVFVQKDGVVLHEHPGAKGLHGPWISHKAVDAHKGVNVKAVTKDLKPEELAQYEEALKGKNFSFMWENRKKQSGTWAEQARGLAPRTLRDQRRAEKEKAEAVEAVEAHLGVPADLLAAD